MLNNPFLTGALLPTSLCICLSPGYACSCSTEFIPHQTRLWPHWIHQNPPARHYLTHPPSHHWSRLRPSAKSPGGLFRRKLGVPVQYHALSLRTMCWLNRTSLCLLSSLNWASRPFESRLSGPQACSWILSA